MKLTVVSTDGTAQDWLPYTQTLQRWFTVPTSGKFLRLKHDYQTPEWNYRPRDAATKTEVPETIHFNPFEASDFVPLTREREEFVLATMRIADPTVTRAQMVTRWRELTRTSVCFTDAGNSWDRGRASYVLGVNLTAAPMGWKMLAFGGNIVRQISSNVVEAIDYTQALPDPERLHREKPWLFQWATQCYMAQTGKYEYLGGRMRPSYAVGRFPHMRPVGTLVPLFGAGGKTRIMESWRYESIANGAAYSPYVP